MHTMGLAVDIALINSRLETIYEIRDVLQKMQDAGDILFIGERRQLVFHVVPQPSRLGYFNDVYLREVGAPLTSRSAEAIAFLDAPRLAPTHLQLHPQVTTEVIAMFPAEGPLQNLWVEDSRPAAPVAAAHTPWLRAALADARGYWQAASGARWLALLFACASAWVLASRPPAHATLLER
jgi:hypothetical protein